MSKYNKVEIEAKDIKVGNKITINEWKVPFVCTVRKGKYALVRRPIHTSYLYSIIDTEKMFAGPSNRLFPPEKSEELVDLIIKFDELNSNSTFRIDGDGISKRRGVAVVRVVRWDLKKGGE